MTERETAKRWSIGRFLVFTLIGLAVAILVSAIVVFSRYVETEDADATSAARAFETARAALVGQAPLVECSFLEPPVVRRVAPSPRAITRLHVLVYSESEGLLRRMDVPFGLIRLITLGGHRRVMDICGDGRHALTLNDIEDYGPGLIVDFAGDVVQFLAASDALFGTRTANARMLMWTE
jgi:hypothetical protein